MRFLYVILDILEPLKIITKMAESQSVTMPYLRKVIDEQIVILESLKNHPGSNERKFENLIVTVEAPNPMQPRVQVNRGSKTQEKIGSRRPMVGRF